MRVTPVAKAKRALSLLAALIMHGKRAAQTPLPEKVDGETSPLGANGSINTLWREMLQALIGRQKDSSVRPSQVGRVHGAPGDQVAAEAGAPLNREAEGGDPGGLGWCGECCRGVDFAVLFEFGAMRGLES
jgi:hypothetical protein